MGWRELIVSLNSLGVGDIESLRRKVLAAEAEIRARGEAELADRLGEAAGALQRGQLAEYRRLLNHVVSRLGHLKQ